MPNKKTPADVSKMIKDHEVKLVDFKFTDLPGSWQHFTTTLTEYDEEIFTEGLGFDGSSIRGWKAINASDMLVIPDPATAWIDIFNAEPTLSLICTIVEPITREPYNRDPRGVAEKRVNSLKCLFSIVKYSCRLFTVSGSRFTPSFPCCNRACAAESVKCPQARKRTPDLRLSIRQSWSSTSFHHRDWGNPACSARHAIHSGSALRA
jgi:hypothetical protein